jgi:hypothetical protein
MKSRSMSFRGCLVAWLLVLLASVALFFAAVLEREPLVSRDETISPTSISEARRLLAQNDPRRLRGGEERTAVIPVGLLDAGINHLASRGLGARAALMVVGRRAELRLTARLPGLRDALYVNLRAVLAEAEGEPRIVSAAIATLSIPPSVAEMFVACAIRAAGAGNEWKTVRQALRGIDFDAAEGVVAVRYVWQPDLLKQARSLAFTTQDMARIQAAQEALAALLDHHSPRVRLPLGRVLVPLLTCCGTPTPERGRAALLVLANHLAGSNLAQVLPAARTWPRPRRVKLTLLGRYDSAQHFGISAALAAWAGEPAANAIGLDKELRDARGGSGFSFADLAADRAGTRFGELVAMGSPRLEQALRGTMTDAELAPALDGLPENLSEDEFERRFGDRDSASYRQLSNEIEARLAALPLYR